MFSNIIYLLTITKSWKYVVFYVLIVFFSIIFELATFSVFAQLIDRLIGGDRDNIYLLEQRNFFQVSLVQICILVIISASFKLLQLLGSSLLPQKLGYEINSLLASNYLNLTNGSQQKWGNSELIADLTVKTNTVVYSTLAPLLSSVSAVLTISSMLCYLLFIDFTKTLYVLALFATFYGLVFLSVTRKINNIALQLNYTQDEINQKALDISLVRRLDRYFGTSRAIRHGYLGSEYENRKSRVIINFISQLPKLIFELLIFLAILAYANVQQLFEISSIYLVSLGLVAQRIFPLVQQIFSQLTTMFSNKEISDSVVRHLNLPKLNLHRLQNKLHEWSTMKVVIDGKGISNIDIEFVNGQSYSILGASGTGKSTTLGVLSADMANVSGRLYVDGELIADENCNDHFNRTSYAAQHDTLPKITLGEFVTGKVDFSDEDISKVSLLIDNLGLSERLKKTTEWWLKGLSTSENLLSGGEIQRIFVAQALFKECSIYIFDEPTSALDSATEDKVLEFIFDYLEGKTVIIVSHSKKVGAYCDNSIDLSFSKPDEPELNSGR